ncbi:MAG: DUF4956 domain-containing protein [Lachnospiraceae bacterium]|nr:DUF4956 domain-containing protein [Lachnospiraceae bacterium]
MSISDIIKQSMEQGTVNTNLSASNIIVTALAALLCSLVIYFVYKFFFRGAVYSENFNILNVLLCIVTSFIITTIRSDLMLSLGMVGALSIVRFRSAVKDPLDIGFLFWSISTGIAIGAGLFPFAVITTICIAVIYIVISLLSSGKNTYLLVVKYTAEKDSDVRNALNAIKNTLKSKNVYKDCIELTVQVSVKKGKTGFVNKISEIEGVESAILVEYTGDYL